MEQNDEIITPPAPPIEMPTPRPYGVMLREMTGRIEDFYGRVYEPHNGGLRRVTPRCA